LATGTVVVLTYLNARKTLLNPVYTEYQKLVITRLAEFSNELASEFDPESPNYWLKENSVQRAVEAINTGFEKIRAGTPTGNDWEVMGYMVSDDEMRALRLVDSIRSDPFIPENIRNKAVDMLEGRAAAIRSAEDDAYDYYRSVLANGEGLETMDENWHWVHNLVNKNLYKQGFGISQMQTKVDDLRREIQGYLKSFDPT
jgi:hypothetical protein